LYNQFSTFTAWETRSVNPRALDIVLILVEDGIHDGVTDEVPSIIVVMQLVDSTRKTTITDAYNSVLSINEACTTSI
jgi:hypothetical protein